jgi:hypothetical protein
LNHPARGYECVIEVAVAALLRCSQRDRAPRPCTTNEAIKTTVALEPIDEGGRTPVPRRGRIRRCSVRYVAILPAPPRGDASVEVTCLLGGVEHPLPLGTMDEARPICNACTARSVWRADED